MICVRRIDNSIYRHPIHPGNVATRDDIVATTAATIRVYLSPAGFYSQSSLLITYREVIEMFLR